MGLRGDKIKVEIPHSNHSLFFKKYMNKLLFTLLFGVSSFLSIPCIAQEALTNKSIVELKKAGFSSELIKTTIAANACTFQTDLQSIIMLKKDGIDESVISEMIKKGSTGITKPSVQLPLVSKSAFIDKIKESGPGIYYVDQDSTIQALEPAVFSGAKQNGVASRFSGLFNAKSNSSLSGERANVQMTNDDPRFYFYFSAKKDNLNDQNSWYGNATSPNQFVIFMFRIKKGQREITVGKQSNVGSSGGIDARSQQLFKFKKLENGLYECYFERPLPKGEYGIMYGGVQQTERVYDFGIIK